MLGLNYDAEETYPMVRGQHVEDAIASVICCFARLHGGAAACVAAGAIPALVSLLASAVAGTAGAMRARRGGASVDNSSARPLSGWKLSRCDASRCPRRAALVAPWLPPSDTDHS
jgi:hypothetical protein